MIVLLEIVSTLSETSLHIVGIAVIGEIQMIGIEFRENVAVGIRILFRKNDTFEEHTDTVGLGGIIEGFAGNVSVIGKAHGQEIVVLIDVESVLGVEVGVSGHRCLLLFGLLNEQPFYREEGAQLIILRGGLAGNVSLNTNLRIELHDGDRNNAVEGLNVGQLPEHTHVVHRAVEIAAGKLLIGQLQRFLAFDAVLHNPVTGGAVHHLADGQEGVAADQDHCRGNGEGHFQESAFLLPAEAIQQDVGQNQAGNGDDTDDRIAGNIVIKTKLPFLTVQSGRQTDGQHKRNGDTGGPAAAAEQIDGVILQRNHRGKTDHQDGHIVPSCIVGLIKRHKQAVETGDKCHDQTGTQQLFQPVLLFGLHIGNDTGHGEQRDPDTQRGPFCSLIAEQEGIVDQIRREEHIVEDLHRTAFLPVDPEVPALLQVAETGAGIAQKG